MLSGVDITDGNSCSYNFGKSGVAIIRAQKR